MFDNYKNYLCCWDLWGRAENDEQSVDYWRRHLVTEYSSSISQVIQYPFFISGCNHYKGTWLRWIKMEVGKTKVNKFKCAYGMNYASTQSKRFFRVYIGSRKETKIWISEALCVMAAQLFIKTNIFNKFLTVWLYCITFVFYQQFCVALECPMVRKLLQHIFGHKICHTYLKKQIILILNC